MPHIDEPNHFKLHRMPSSLCHFLQKYISWRYGEGLSQWWHPFCGIVSPHRSIRLQRSYFVDYKKLTALWILHLCIFIIGFFNHVVNHLTILVMPPGGRRNLPSYWLGRRGGVLQGFATGPSLVLEARETGNEARQWNGATASCVGCMCVCFRHYSCEVRLTHMETSVCLFVVF